MKVFFTIDALINAGTEKSMLEIIPHFSKNTNASVVYFYPRHELKEAYEHKNIPLYFMDLKGGFSFLRGVKLLKRLIRKEKPDIIVSSLLRANLISRAACYLTGTKLIGTFVSDSYSPQRTSGYHLKRRIGFAFYYWLDRLTAFIPAAWISNSESIKRSNCQKLHVKEEIVEVIYRGRHIPSFKAWQPPGNEKFVFATMGRLLVTKGFAELINAFAMIAQQYPPVHLDIYGEGADRSLFEKQIDRLGLNEKITLHGNVINASGKLYGANCFVFPSWYEGFSGSLVEAMMMGIPVIASDIPMNLEAVTDKQTALVHKVKDTDSLFACMKTMMDDYNGNVQMGARARDEAIRRFDIVSIAKQYEDFLHSIQINK